MIEEFIRRLDRNVKCPHTNMGERELKMMLEPIMEAIDKKPDLQELADKCFEKWINGNLTEVIDTIAALPPMQAAVLAVELAAWRPRGPGCTTAERFIALMEERVKCSTHYASNIA